MSNRKIVVDHHKLAPDVRAALEEQYPFGYGDAVFKFTDHKNNTYSSILLQIAETTYLVKLDKISDLADQAFDEYL